MYVDDFFDKGKVDSYIAKFNLLGFIIQHVYFKLSLEE